MFLLTQFILVNGHFTLNLLAGLVCFAVAWLYFDAWLGRKAFQESSKSLGFLLLSVSFIVHATAIEQSLLETSALGPETINLFTAIFRISAYIVLSIAQIIDPLQPLPEYRGVAGFGKRTAAVVPLAAIPVIQLVPFSYPILAVATGFLYLRRATAGLEHHLKPISYSFFILSFSELISQAATFRATDNVTIANIVAPFGPLWLIEHTILAIAIFILGHWVWGYLIKRLETQLLMIFTTSTLIIFLITTVFFTTASMQNLRKSALGNLEINVNVLQYTIDSKKAETLSDAQVVAQNEDIISGVKDQDKTKLKDLTISTLLAKNQAFLVVVSHTGAILVRADDPDKVGGSLSNDPLVEKALAGQNISSVATTDGVIAPTVSVRAATPIKSGEEVIGAVMIGTDIDNAFVDGLKSATNLDASVYADNIRSATTFVAPDGKSRWVGIKEETPTVIKPVLTEGKAFTGTVNILNIPYFAAFSPLEDLDGNPIGMLFVGKPQVSLLQSASESIELTFIVTAALLILSVIPAYFVSRYIINQIH